MRRLVAVLWVLPLLGQGIASRGVKPAPRSKPSGRPFAAKYSDVAKAAGITAPSIYGGVERITYLLETSAGGMAWLDYDGDGWMDLFIANGTRFEKPEPAEATNRLYRNKHDGTFADVTEAAGLRRTGWAMGATSADFDNDGHPDLFVTYWGESVLYRNRGDGRFDDVTEKAGLRRAATPRPYWDTGATFFDYDRDGHLDLFVSGYVDLDLARTPKPGQNANCNWKGIAVACGPRGLRPGRHFLFHSNGDGTFTDVSQRAGVAKVTTCFGMTAVSADLDDDGWPDLYVACDSTPSLFFHNQRNGTFAEEGIERGIALNDDGREQAGMGVGLGDFNLDGRLDILKTHFADDTHILYQNDGGGSFRDVTLASGLAVETRYVGWGAGIFDFDNDGWPDLFVATGNVYPETQKELPAYPYFSPRLLFRNLGNGKFEQLVDEAGPAMSGMHSSRGAAFGDYDNDGDVDIAIWNRNQPPSLLRNDLGGEAHWLELSFIGTKSNRSAIGAKVTVRYGGKVQVREVASSGSFYSSNDPRLHFGLGTAATVDLSIRWPNGKLTERKGLAADRLITIREDEN